MLVTAFYYLRKERCARTDGRTDGHTDGLTDGHAILRFFPSCLPLPTHPFTPP